MSLFLVSQHSFFFKDSFFPSFLTHHHQTATKTCFIPPKKKKKKIPHLTQLLEARQKQTLLSALKSPPPPHGMVTAWWCFLPHIPGTKPHRTVRSTKAQFSPKLYSQAFLPDELGRKSGNRSGDTCACV